VYNAGTNGMDHGDKHSGVTGVITVFNITGVHGEYLLKRLTLFGLVISLELVFQSVTLSLYFGNKRMGIFPGTTGIQDLS
jgi:hypothetical protein